MTRSGESIVMPVLAGDRKVKQGAFGSGLQSADQDRPSPSKLQRLAAEQRVGVFGPVGFGVDAFRMMHKGNTETLPAF